MPDHAIAAERLSAGYRGRRLLHEISLDVPAGRITVLLGANGSGKSTLLKTLAGLHPAQGGEVRLGGEPLAAVTGRRLARRLAFLPQQPSAPETLTVGQLVMMGRYPYRRLLLPPSPDDHRAVAEAMAQTQVAALADRPLGRLSGGQRQRAWLAMVLAQQAEILMLDEPTSYLDLSHQYELLNLLRRLNQDRRMTLMIVLHDLNQAFEFADHLVYLREGRLVAEGAPAETADPALIERVFGLACEIRPHPRVDCPLLIPLAGEANCARVREVKA
ncbi:ABC transporter ATP-binding protein [Billgrantia azerbaijanica]|nr:ABC transporter ATP-binding protein [Halomonas azerbaijanica]